MAFTTEHSYATGSIRALERIGFTIHSADDGEERLWGPMSATAAIDHVRGTEHGSVRLEHPTLGRVTLCFLFQNGEPEEVLYDMGAATETLELIDAILPALIKFQGGN